MTLIQGNVALCACCIAAASTMVITSADAGESVLFTITLDGTQSPDGLIDTPALGSGAAAYDFGTGEFSWEISFADLSADEVAAHFHGPAELCDTAGVQIILPNGTTKIGSQVITPEQADDLLAGLWYVNIHSTEHPGGEIRGQVLPVAELGPLFDPIAPSAIHLQPQQVASELTAPNWGTSAPGIDGRLFVTDQDGQLWNVNLDTGETNVMLDVSDQLVTLGVFGEGSFDERGLLGVAFHPDYATNGRVYTYQSEPTNGLADYSTMPDGVDPNHDAVIVEWQVVDPTDPDTTVDPSTRRELLRVEEPQFNHNAGALAFDANGVLYIAFGDGGGADDKDGQTFIGETILGHSCLGNGQDGTNPLGSILAVDPLGNNGPNSQYGIPAGNPYVGTSFLDETYVYGCRNPFRMSFDMLTGELYVADVGQNDVEEINVVQAGANLGWPAREGSFNFIQNGATGGYVTSHDLSMYPASLTAYTDPIAEYGHDEGIAVVGGYVYRGGRIPALDGRYVFGEFALTFSNDGRLFHLNDSNVIEEFVLDGGKEFGRSVLGFAQDSNGEVYVLANSTGTPFGDTGVVMKLVPKPGDANADGVVNVDDLLQLLKSWGPCDACAADFDEDGDIDVDDLLTLLSNWD